VRFGAGDSEAEESFKIDPANQRAQDNTRKAKEQLERSKIVALSGSVQRATFRVVAHRAKPEARGRLLNVII
jgi:hypothetical protein